MVINQDLLSTRKKISNKRPKFIRQESWRYDRLAENWRRPKGKDNKMRRQFSGVPELVKIGYGGPRNSRGLHPSGYTDNIVHNPNDLGIFDNTKDAIRIAHTVGTRKRTEILNKAKELGLKVINPGIKKTETKKSIDKKLIESNNEIKKGRSINGS